ncbi:hypothetical protein F2Q69_00000255 [Brassica cretica]|uniref:Sulfotransferase n=1 Tax=Brassica cretica TaxID=69181 RepID=A0A8S9NXF5_BRACR|nr:hypothetical protein F2Q69_00000255 [Brassica cretica]
MDHNELPVNLREDKISEETKKLITSLPTDKDSQGNLCKYQGCWYYYNTFQAVISFQKHFQPQDTDIILASTPKSGTTWLKALTVALLERSKHHDDHPLNHPLLSNNPHALVPLLESSTPDLTMFSPSSSTRLFSTHMPFHTLKEGCPFTEEEEESGGVNKILELCSLRSLSDLEANKSGKTVNGVDYKFFFRKGEVGDWKNHLTPEMESKIDTIIEEKLRGSGLSF